VKLSKYINVANRVIPVIHLLILKQKNRLEKVCRICTEFTKMMRRIFSFFLVQNSDNPSLNTNHPTTQR